MSRISTMTFPSAACCTAFLCIATSVGAQGIDDARQPRDLNHVDLIGLETIPAEAIHRRLASHLDVVESQHPAFDDATYQYRVQNAVERGMRASGFLDSQVSCNASNNDGDRLRITITEGHRYSRGGIVVKGGSDHVNQWVSSSIALREKNDKPIWNTKKPANGDLFSRMKLTSEIQEALTGIGLSGSQARIDFVRNEEAKSVDLHVHLSFSDATFTIPADPTTAPTKGSNESDTNTAASQSKPGPEGQLAASSIERELNRIFNEYFAEPTPGMIVRAEHKETLTKAEFSNGHAVVDWIDKDASRQLVISPDVIMVSMDQPSAAFQVPVSGITVSFLEQAESESDKGATFKVQINGALRFGKQPEPAQSPSRHGFVFSPKAWTDWFPPDSTRMKDTESGRVFEYRDHRLLINSLGHFVELSGSIGENTRLEVSAVKDEEIERRAASIISESNAETLLVHDPDTGEQIGLNDVVDRVREGRPDKHHFFIPPTNGKLDILGTALLIFSMDDRFIQRDPHITPLVKLIALDISRRRQGIAERIKQLEPEAMSGPGSALALGVIADRNALHDQAILYHTRAMELAGDRKAVQREIDLLINESNFIGRIFARVDVKSMLKLALGFAQFSDAGEVQRRIESLVSQMPDTQLPDTQLPDTQLPDTQLPDTQLPDLKLPDSKLPGTQTPDTQTLDEQGEAARIDNARLVAWVIYEMSYREQFEKYCESRIASIQQRQVRLAKKQREKREKAKEKRKSLR